MAFFLQSNPSPPRRFKCCGACAPVSAAQGPRLRALLSPRTNRTQVLAALDEVFAPVEAKRMLDRLGFHLTPQHSRCLDTAEIESGRLPSCSKFRLRWSTRCIVWRVKAAATNRAGIRQRRRAAVYSGLEQYIIKWCMGQEPGGWVVDTRRSTPEKRRAPGAGDELLFDRSIVRCFLHWGCEMRSKDRRIEQQVSRRLRPAPVFGPRNGKNEVMSRYRPERRMGECLSSDVLTAGARRRRWGRAPRRCGPGAGESGGLHRRAGTGSQASRPVRARGDMARAWRSKASSWENASVQRRWPFFFICFLVLCAGAAQG